MEGEDISIGENFILRVNSFSFCVKYLLRLICIDSSVILTLTTNAMFENGLCPL